jgi:hypothetical protein
MLNPAFYSGHSCETLEGLVAAISQIPEPNWLRFEAKSRIFVQIKSVRCGDHHVDHQVRGSARQ